MFLNLHQNFMTSVTVQKHQMRVNSTNLNSQRDKPKEMAGEPTCTTVLAKIATERALCNLCQDTLAFICTVCTV